jgi:hypothetical protein
MNWNPGPTDRAMLRTCREVWLTRLTGGNLGFTPKSFAPRYQPHRPPWGAIPDGVLISIEELPAGPQRRVRLPAATLVWPVKPPLIQMPYATGWVARCDLEARLSPAHRRDRHPRISALPPSPGTALSAQEAKEKLREIVEGFFFRGLTGEDGQHIPRLLVKKPAGLGKTGTRWLAKLASGTRGLTGPPLAYNLFVLRGVP